MTAEIPLICSIDVGTTSTRVILFTKEGEEITKHQIEYSTSAQQGSKRNSPNIFTNEGIALNTKDENLEVEELSKNPTLSFPKPGWVECNPAHLLANILICLANVVTNLEIINSEEPLDNSEKEGVYKIVSIGIANMRETTIVWSKKTGRSLYDGIVWNDTRTLHDVNHLLKVTPEETLADLKNRSGCPISTYFSALKWKWLYENIPAIKKSYDSNDKDIMFGTVDTWLIYNLTKEKSFVTDMSNASRTFLMNLETKDYDDTLLNFWGIDKSKIQLPKIVPSSYNYGSFQIPDIIKLGYKTKHIDSEQIDLLKQRVLGIPITGCLGDQSSSLVGQLALRSGDAKCTYGTGAFLLFNTGNHKLISKHGAVTTVGYWFDKLDPSVDGEGSNEPQYCLEGSIAVAGACVQWLRDNLKLIGKASDIGPLAATAKNSGGVVFVPAFSGLFAPYWDSKTTGTIFGLTQYSTAAHIARAAIEGVCFQVRAILKAMINDAGKSSDYLDTDNENTCARDSLLSTLHVDGGMSKSDTVMQIQADFLGPCVNVVRSEITECTALGAAIASGLYPDIGIYKSLKDVEDAIAATNHGSAGNGQKANNNNFSADMADEDRRKAWKLWERAISRAKHWLTSDDSSDDE